MSLPRGLYEQLLTRLLKERLARGDQDGVPERGPLRNAEAADRIALHVARVVERAIEEHPEENRSSEGVLLARRLIELVKAPLGLDEQLIDPAELLRSIGKRLPDGSAESYPVPLIPLLDTTLLTNSPGEPSVGHQIKAEIASADRIDIVMAFIRRTGINPMLERLKQHVEQGRQLRILTTVYTGTTELEALEVLTSVGAEIRVSYDTGSTRLHAKAWVFHRESGFSTAYVGSSNLTHAAQVSGLEWNIRVSEARNRAVIEKISAVFESYWQQPDFEEFNRDRFLDAREPGSQASGIMLSPIEIRLEPFQERLLEQIELSRQQGYHRNLLVSATGTGKTVMAAVDYARLRSQLSRSRLLFVAHREEILRQSRATFAHALRDGTFGELWVGNSRPQLFDHVFASIQSLNASGIDQIDPKHFDVVIVDEFHHAAAKSYERLLNQLEPIELVGLTATPERSDGLNILHWFGDRVAAELRLWDAIDQHRLVPFSYFGIADNLDLRQIPWKRGTGYDVEALTKVITANDVWARAVVQQYRERLSDSSDVRALGFCVSVAHAEYMARVFNEAGIPAVAVSASTTEEKRQGALDGLRAGHIRIVFSVDLFNEGVDVPDLNALLMLRPTESPLLFLQQLGRGLRKASGKALCTVLDFVGQHRKEFRYDRRFQAVLGGSRAYVEEQIEQGFPFLPSGCSMQLDRVATERVLESIAAAIPSRWNDKVNELRRLASEESEITLAMFLEQSGLEVEDVYSNNRSWSDLCAAANLPLLHSGSSEDLLRRAIGRLLHVDDLERLTKWREWMLLAEPPEIAKLAPRERRLIGMLLVQLFGRSKSTLDKAARELWQHEQVRAELVELFDVLETRLTHVPISFAERPEVPFRIHARYTRLEILSALAHEDSLNVRPWREGTLFDEKLKVDVFAFTLDKTSGQFSPTTRYRDYAINNELIHWESQSTTRASSKTGQRYQNHASTGDAVLLFARLTTSDRAFFCLGPATYVSHVRELPMAVTWRLKHRLPGDMFQKFAAAVA